MKIAADIHLKHGILFNALKQLDWTLADLSRASGVCESSIGSYMRLQSQPRRDTAEKIRAALSRNEVYISLECLMRDGFVPVDKTALNPWFIFESKTESIELHPEALMLEAPHDDVSLEDMRAVIKTALSTLTEQERTVIEMSFGLSGSEQRSCAETGRVLNVCEVRVRQVQSKALRRLRHPTLSHIFEEVK